MPAPPAQAPDRDVARITLTVLGIGLLLVGTAQVMLPFLASLLWAITIVVSTWPLMLAIQARLGGRRGPAVGVMTVVLLLILFVPLYLAVATIVSESYRVAELSRALPTLRVPAPPPWVEALPLVGRRLAGRWLELSALDPEALSGRLEPHLRTALAWFAASAGSFGSMVVHFLLTVVISAILYTKGEDGAGWLRRFFRRLSGERGDAIVVLAGKAIRAVALGIVVTALVQTALAGIGLVAVGAPFPGFVTAVVFILCIAQLGPLLAMAPCVIWLYAAGSPARATLLLVITVVIQAIDNVLRPLLIRRGANISLLIIFPGVIGGLISLGIIGLFVGPVVLAVTWTLVDSWITGLTAAAPEATSAPPDPSATAPAPPAVAERRSLTPR
jgi:predicted PurR-regulated permease PerM